jgi:hypothetical protein
MLIVLFEGVFMSLEVDESVIEFGVDNIDLYFCMVIIEELLFVIFSNICLLEFVISI